MAATGATPISLYYSTTASTAPTAGNLVNGELAINITDGKIFYKDNAGVVQTIATKNTAAGTFTSITDSGNLTFTGTGNRITGDFSNATIASRVTFQSSTSNGSTTVGAIPNGTNTLAQFTAFGGNDPDNAQRISISTIGGSDHRFTATYSGTPTSGTYLPITMYTGGSERLRIDTSGNVGIGTSSPGANNKLHISSAGTTRLYIENTANSVGVRLQTLSNAGLLQTDTNHPLTFATNNGAEAMRIDTSGNLLVNTTTIASQGKITLDFNGTGNQGINLKETAGQASAGFMYFQYSTTVLGTITRVLSTNAIAYNTTSDIRLKENITEAKPALDTVSNIKVRQYDWIGCENSHQEYGFIAQELAEIVSDVVTKGRTEEDTWAVDYGKLTPILCKAIQELNAKVTALEAQLAAK